LLEFFSPSSGNRHKYARAEKPDRGIAGWKEYPVPFQTAVGKADLGKIVGSAHLHPDKVIGIIDHSHPVCFSITDNDFRLSA